jgi:hypothetical protein
MIINIGKTRSYGEATMKDIMHRSQFRAIITFLHVIIV